MRRDGGVAWHVYVTPEGGVWVERSRRVADSTSVYDVSDPNGRLMAGIKLPKHSQVVGIGKTSLYVIRETPDDGLKYLEQWKRPQLA